MSNGCALPKKLSGKQNYKPYKNEKNKGSFIAYNSKTT